MAKNSLWRPGVKVTVNSSGYAACKLKKKGVKQRKDLCYYLLSLWPQPFSWRKPQIVLQSFYQSGIFFLFFLFRKTILTEGRKIKTSSPLAVVTLRYCSV